MKQGGDGGGGDVMIQGGDGGCVVVYDNKRG